MAKITKAIFGATSPTVQYGNVHTVLEVEGDDWEEIRDLGLAKISEVDAMVSSTPLTLNKPPRVVKSAVTRVDSITSRFTGVTLQYDPVKHIYTDFNGNRQLSGSQFPNQFYEPFDKVKAIEMVQKAYPDAGVTPEELSEMWSRNGYISTSFGTAVHAALENYIRHNNLGDGIKGVDKSGKAKPNKAFSKNPFFSKLVRDYVEKFGVGGMISEEFVADGRGHCGRIDYIKVIDKDKKIIRIGDFKTDADLFEKKYQKKTSPFKGKIKNKEGKDDNTLFTYHIFQLSYYAYILAQFGYNTEGLDIDWLNPNTLEWERHSADVIDLTEVLKGDE